MPKDYDYLLKVLLVGDSDVGKHEIMAGLEDASSESPFCSRSGNSYKITTILLDGKRVRLCIWDTSGQGRFCTIIRSYSRGAQGVILVYDICNKWSFDGIDRWLKEVEEHAPGVPKVLVGNRLHLAFKRQVAAKQAELYASRNKMACFEISPLCDFNIRESFCELARMALHRNGMERIWRSNKGKFGEINQLQIMDRKLKKKNCECFFRSFSTFTARVVLSRDCSPNVCLCNRSIAIAAIGEITSQIIRTHIIPMHQHNEQQQHKEEWPMQNAHPTK
ncbi:ras-related protein Rab-40B isoform X1 [Sitodiplosis mosellana]|uniref:ras-related protein Rab-40B isoform X1 n=1 Tax=Sitodiplosis mosellana TaxID=263140 RepID=UPI002443E565|nr:ras-related protein Rab-40B isoform X1 [Sitodiplosis mosellana]